MTADVVQRVEHEITGVETALAQVATRRDAVQGQLDEQLSRTVFYDEGQVPDQAGGLNAWQSAEADAAYRVAWRQRRSVTAIVREILRRYCADAERDARS